jgi:acetolactate synthase I/II/III large subunit
VGKEATYGSDLVVDLLRERDVPYVALNPGATIRGLHDSLVTYGGNATPEVILCAHEEVAVALAHGYAKASGRTMAVALHNIVGLQHATMAIFNAWCDRVPILLLGGSGPADESQRRPWIDWIHWARQGEMVRDYVKWETEPASIDGVAEAVARAWQVARSSPCGPVYVALDAAIQEAAVPQSFDPFPPDVLTRGDRYERIPAAAAPPTSVEDAADLLLDADMPVILANSLGRVDGLMDVLVELAERLASPVIEWSRGGTSFPSRHPLNATGDEKHYLRETDIVLALNVINPWSMLSSVDERTRRTSRLTQPSSKIIQVGDDHLPASSWTAEHGRLQPADVHIPVHPSAALRPILEACRRRSASRSQIDRRRKAASDRRSLIVEGWRTEASSNDDTPIRLSRLASELWTVIDGSDWVLANGTAGGWALKLWNLDRPGSYLGDSGGAGKGYGPGAAVGAALAYRNTATVCVDIQGDGDLLYTPAALWTAAHLKVPLLVIVLNNSSYYVDEAHQAGIAAARQRPTDDVAVGVRLEEPTIDYAGLARSFGVLGLGPVDSPLDLHDVLTRAYRHVRETSTPALVDCVTAPN